jgi:hypothetical protein
MTLPFASSIPDRIPSDGERQEEKGPMGRKQQKPMIFESKMSADPLERTVQLGNTAERLGAVADEIEVMSTMLEECRLAAQAKTLHSMVEPIQQIIEHLRSGKDLNALLEREKIRKSGTALMVAYLTKPEGETFKIKRP